MENFRVIKILFCLIGGGIAFSVPFFVFGYDDKTAHPALTQEVAKFFNYSYPEKGLNEEEIKIVMKGSVDEDEAPRWMRHFYDPVYDKGFVYLGQTWEKSKDWAQDTLAQADYGYALGDKTFGSILPLFSAQTDYSWERAIYDYVWKDKNRGLYALGHILHLIEDATVPEHTRNDPHPGIWESTVILDSSPYESWTKKFNPENINMAQGIYEENIKPSVLSGLNDYFDKTAVYSNNNFFSGDTIVDSKYKDPIPFFFKKEILSDGKTYMFGYRTLDNTLGYKLVARSANSDWYSEVDGNKFFLDDNDSLILTDYWNLLSKQAVINGAGVVKLFFDEAAKEQETKALWRKNRSWLGQAWDWVRETTDWITSVPGPADIVQTPAQLAFIAGGITSAKVGPLQELADSQPGFGTLPVPEDAAVFAEIPTATSTETLVETPAETLEEGPVWSSQLEDQTPEGKVEPFTSSTTPVSTPNPIKPYSLGKFIIGGGGDYKPPVEASPAENYGGSTSIAEEVEPPPTLPPAETESPAVPDTTPPDIFLVIKECENSFSEESCVVATTTFNLSWSSSATDLAGSSVTCGFRRRPSQSWQSCENFSYDPAATSTASSTAVFTASPNTTYLFKAKAMDSSGNESAETEKIAEINSSPVIINEIAWMGTGGSAVTSKDEWLELYNRSGASINLSGWRLKFYRPEQSDSPNIIKLSGAVLAKNYYLIERTDDNTLPDIPADLTASFGSGLVDDGMIVKLEKGSTTIDRTPDIGPFWPAGTGWCAGDKNSRATMERIVPEEAGEIRENWATYSAEEIKQPHKNSEGGAIFGTPKARNINNYYIRTNAFGGSPLTEIILFKENSPYIVNRGGLTINNGVTLKAEPGAIIKILGAGMPMVYIHGRLDFGGAGSEPVVVTSIYDDEYGGDTNQDGVCRPGNASSTAICPGPGSWFRFIIDSGGSVVKHAIFRYGGAGFDYTLPGYRTMFLVDGQNISLSDSRFEYSGSVAVSCLNCSGAINKNVFSHNSAEAILAGESSRPEICDNSFIGNGTGVYAADAPNTFVCRNLFKDNGTAVSVTHNPPRLEGNSAMPESRGLNAVLLGGALYNDYVFEPGLPYAVSAGSYYFGAKATLNHLRLKAKELSLA